MRFWFLHTGEVSLREQLVTQVLLGIAGGDLKPGERLPSTRALARRYGLHANTVSTAYQHLQHAGALEMRRGSGVYVREAAASAPSDPASRLRALTQAFLQGAREAGFSSDAIAASLQSELRAKAQRDLLLVEPGPALRAIVLRELADAGVEAVRACGFEDLSQHTQRETTLLALPSKAGRARATGLPVTALQITSVGQSLADHGTIPPDVLIGIASHWSDFLKHAQTMLLAAGVAPECLVIRDANHAGWRDGLGECAAVICDVLTAQQLPRGPRAIVFRILSNDGFI